MLLDASFFFRNIKPMVNAATNLKPRVVEVVYLTENIKKVHFKRILIIIYQKYNNIEILNKLKKGIQFSLRCK